MSALMLESFNKKPPVNSTEQSHRTLNRDFANSELYGKAPKESMFSAQPGIGGHHRHDRTTTTHDGVFSARKKCCPPTRPSTPTLHSLASFSTVTCEALEHNSYTPSTGARIRQRSTNAGVKVRAERALDTVRRKGTIGNEGHVPTATATPTNHTNDRQTAPTAHQRDVAQHQPRRQPPQDPARVMGQLVCGQHTRRAQRRVPGRLIARRSPRNQACTRMGWTDLGW